MTWDNDDLVRKKPRRCVWRKFATEKRDGWATGCAALYFAWERPELCPICGLLTDDGGEL